MRKKARIAEDAICRAYNVAHGDVLSRRRPWRLVLPRWALVKLLFEVLGLGNEDVETLLKLRRPSSTRMRRSFKRELETNRKCREFYEKIENELRPKLNAAWESYPTRPAGCRSLGQLPARP